MIKHAWHRLTLMQYVRPGEDATVKPWHIALGILFYIVLMLLPHLI